LRGGMIIAPAQDASAFRAFLAMVVSLHLMSLHTSGWACLLGGCAVLKTSSFSRILGWLFLFAGIVWIPATTFPQLAGVSQFAIIAGLLYIVARVWIGIALLRGKQTQPVAKAVAASR
jgi:hypothetical protein